MKTVGPIRDKKLIELVKMYLKNKNLRDYLMFVMGINCNLRIGDLLQLKVSDVWNGRRCKEYIELYEQKTGKFKKIKINENMERAIKEYIKEVTPGNDDYLFLSTRGEGKPISRQQAHHILSQAGDYCGLEEPLAPHSLRKTWGYWAWKNGASLVIIMEALNHSSISITKRYLGITQEDVDNVYINLNL